MASRQHFHSLINRLLRDKGWPFGAPPAGAKRPALHDEQVMAAVKAGSVAAFSVLYERYCDRVYRVARSVCRDDARAQDAVQEAFVSIWRTRANYDDRRAVAAWVLTVARACAIDVARRNDLHVVRSADDQPCDLLSALAKLPDAQHEIITLACYGQLTHTEITAHLDLPLGTVKRRMRLALDRLRRDIAQLSGGRGHHVT